MRNWDNWLRYQDNNGNPLHGCIQFMVRSGNTVAPIYDNEGTPLANPQLTDNYGRTVHQVFVDTDIVAYFYKYVGEGIWSGQEDIDISDVSKWSLQYTSENTLHVLANITSDNVIAIGTMSALRDVDIDGIPEVEGKKVITLLGYFNSGDKEPINYIWDPESTEQDNGGSVIASNNVITGRWIMVQPTEHCDSRHFGVFPSNSYNMADQTYQIDKLFTYCYTCAIRPYFNGSSEYRWFKYTNLNVIAYEIDVTDETRFYDLGNSTINGNWNGNPLFYNGNTNVVAENIKTSWNAKAYTGYKNVILDAETNQKAWQDAHVVSKLNPTYGYSFNHCTFEANRNFGSNNGTSYNTFYNCTLTGDMFIVSGDNATSFATGQAVNCVVRQEDWMGSDDEFFYYIQLRITNNSDGSFDYMGRTSSKNPIVNYAGSVVNAGVIRLTNYNYTGSTTTLARLSNAIVLEINNCTGNYNLNAWNGQTVIIKNCKDFNISQVPNGLTLMIEDSTVSIASTDTLNELSLRNATFVANEGVVLNCNSFTSYSSIVTCEVSCKNTVMKDSQINAPVTITYDDDIVNAAFIDNNIFNGQLIIKGAQKTPSAYQHVTNTVITNNYSALQTPVNVDRTYLDPVDASHSYVYEGNSGTFLPGDNVTANQTMTCVAPVTMLATDYPDNSFVYAGSDHDATHSGYGFVEIIYDNLWHDNHPNNTARGIYGPFNLFRIGRDDFKVTVTWCINSSNVQIPWFNIALCDSFPMFASKVDSGNNNMYRLNTVTYPGGQDSQRVSANRCGRTLLGVSDPGDFANVQLNCTFTMHKNP